MADIVLVHGAWQGAWCWERIVPLLESHGHTIATPTLTGSGSRSGELAADVGLDTHIDDVVKAIEAFDGDETVVVGHSYSGMVISGVAETMADQLGGLVYVDSFYPNDGESALDQMPDGFPAVFRQQAENEGDGWRLPANDLLLDIWGLHDPDDRQWVRARLTDWSLNCFDSAVRLPERRLASLPRKYVSCSAEGYLGRAIFGPISERASKDGCEVVEVATGHDVMIQAPEDLVQIINSLTGL